MERQPQLLKSTPRIFSTDDGSKKKVHHFWNIRACGTEDFSDDLTREDFEKIEKDRYRRESFIHDTAQFSRWHDKRVLEIGCGSGTDLLQFVRAGAASYAIDLTEKAIQTTRKRLPLYGLRAPLIQGDAEQLAFKNNTFDLVYAWGVLHHTPNPQHAIEEIYRVLKPGGKACVMLYHKPSWYYVKMFYLWISRGYFRKVPFPQYLREATDRAHMRPENPIAYMFTTREARSMFNQYSKIEHRLFYLKHELPIVEGLFQILIDMTMRFSEPWIGFFLVINAWKEEKC